MVDKELYIESIIDNVWEFPVECNENHKLISVAYKKPDVLPFPSAMQRIMRSDDVVDMDTLLTDYVRLLIDKFTEKYPDQVCVIYDTSAPEAREKIRAYLRENPHAPTKMRKEYDKLWIIMAYLNLHELDIANDKIIKFSETISGSMKEILEDYTIDEIYTASLMFFQMFQRMLLRHNIIYLDEGDSDEEFDPEDESVVTEVKEFTKFNLEYFIKVLNYTLITDYQRVNQDNENVILLLWNDKRDIDDKVINHLISRNLIRLGLNDIYDKLITKYFIEDKSPYFLIGNGDTDANLAKFNEQLAMYTSEEELMDKYKIFKAVCMIICMSDMLESNNVDFKDKIYQKISEYDVMTLEGLKEISVIAHEAIVYLNGGYSFYIQNIIS